MIYIKQFENFMENDEYIEIHSPDNQSIKVSRDELDMLIDMGYVYEEDDEYLFHEDSYDTINQILGNVPEMDTDFNINDIPDEEIL
jgi:hypothetical protein